MTSTLPPLAQATSAAIGGVVSKTFLYPLDLILTRIQTTSITTKTKTSNRNNFLLAIKLLYKSNGSKGFFKGLTIDCISTFISNFIYFYAFTFLRQFLIKKRLLSKSTSTSLPTNSISAGSIMNGKGKARGPVLTGFEEIALGCIAGCISKAFTSPLSNITVRAQTASSTTSTTPTPLTSSTLAGIKKGEGEKGAVGNGTKNEEDSSDDEDTVHSDTFSIIKDIYKEKGWTGYWSGYKSSIILTINPAITQYLIEFFRRPLVPSGFQPTIAQTFFTSAVASSCSSAITYPLILAKTRLQFNSTGRNKSNLDVFKRTFKKQGLKGLYSGLELQVLKAFLSEGLKMLIKQRLELIIILAHAIITRRKQSAIA